MLRVVRRSARLPRSRRSFKEIARCPIWAQNRIRMNPVRILSNAL
nr:MAG TPA: hypothetical protein [Caudoviricetes sp.]